MKIALWWPHPLFPYSLHLPLSYYPITLHRITLGKNSRWLVVAFQLIISVIHSVFHLSCSCTCSSLHLSLFIILTEFVIPLYSQSRLTKNKSRLQFSFLSLQCKASFGLQSLWKKRSKLLNSPEKNDFFFVLHSHTPRHVTLLKVFLSPFNASFFFQPYTFPVSLSVQKQNSSIQHCSFDHLWTWKTDVLTFNTPLKWKKKQAVYLILIQHGIWWCCSL